MEGPPMSRQAEARYRIVREGQRVALYRIFQSNVRGDFPTAPGEELVDRFVSVQDARQHALRLGARRGDIELVSP
jgi:hypothetical protein